MQDAVAIKRKDAGSKACLVNEIATISSTVRYRTVRYRTPHRALKIFGFKLGVGCSLELFNRQEFEPPYQVAYCAVRKTGSFLGCGREYSGEYVSTITSTYKRSYITAVFLRALASVIRDVVL